VRPYAPDALVAAWRRRQVGITPDARPWAGPALSAFLAKTKSAPVPRYTGDTEHELFEDLAVADYRLEAADMQTQIEVSTGCEIREPMFDDDLVELVGRVPHHHLIFGGRQRGLQRLAMRGLVPDFVRLRELKAQFGPAHTQVFQAMGGLDAVRDLVEVRALERLGLVNGRMFRDAFKDFARDPEVMSWKPLWLNLWPVLAVEALAQRLEDGSLFATMPSSTVDAYAS
jgi:hypothetical protein